MSAQLIQPMQQNQLVHINGELYPITEAKISVLDRGFIFGDGIYEVIPVYYRKPFRQEQHLARLSRSLSKVGIQNPHSYQEWCDLIATMIETQTEQDQFVYIQVTRGVAKRGHAFPKESTPTVFLMSNPMPVIEQTMRDKGVQCISMDDQRWLHCDIKSTSLLGNVLAAQFAVENEVTETIQWRNGYLTEASSSNVWIVKNKELICPPLDNLILEGIRIGLFQELCEELNIKMSTRKISKEEVFSADEVLLSSATKEVLAVVMLDGQQIGAGVPGAIYHSLYKAYQNKKAP